MLHSVNSQTKEDVLSLLREKSDEDDEFPF
jgi:hypothetical protein